MTQWEETLVFEEVTQQHREDVSRGGGDTSTVLASPALPPPPSPSTCSDTPAPATNTSLNSIRPQFMHCHGTLRHFVSFWFETAAVMKQEGRCSLEEMWVWLFVLRLHVLTPHLAPLLDGRTSKRQEEVNILKWWKELRNVFSGSSGVFWNLRFATSLE